MEKKPTLSLEALADLQVPEDFHISLGGKYVAYSVRAWSKKNDHPTSSIWVADIGKEKSARQLTSGLFKDECPRWSPDGKYVAFGSDRAKAGESSAIYLIPIAGGEPHFITRPENRSKITQLQWAPSGRFIAYLSADEETAEKERRGNEKDDPKIWGEGWEYQRLRYVHVATRQTTTLVSGEQHVHLYSWSSDSHEIAYVLHESSDINSAGFYGAQIQHVNLTTKVCTPICKFPGPIWQFVRGKHGIYFTGGVIPEHASTAMALYKVSDAEQTYGRLLFGIEDCCVQLKKAGSSVLARVQSGLYDEIHELYESQEASRVLYRAMHNITAFDVFVENKDAEPILVITKSDGAQPTEIFSFSAETTGRHTQLSDHNSAIAGLEISKCQPIYAHASDGYQLDGVVFLPSTQEDASKPLPTVVLIHGGPYFRVTIGFEVCHVLEVPLLVSVGYAVLCPNYRGGSSRGQKHAAYSRARMGTVDYSDIVDLVKTGIAQGIVDESRVAIGGWSQGGFLSYLAVTRSDFNFRAAVCGAGVVNWDMMMLTSDMYWFEADLAGGAPWEMSADDESTGRQDKPFIQESSSRRGSPIWHMKNVKTPVLILHGEEDVRVPVSQAIGFWRAGVHRGLTVKMVTYPREGHLFEERKHVIDLWSRMREFYDLHLNSR
jgi:dipeptidyl aminopeptidase/acylaminoacyl peptidase